MLRCLFLSLLAMAVLSGCTGRTNSKLVRKKVVLTDREKEEQRLLVRELESKPASAFIGKTRTEHRRLLELADSTIERPDGRRVYLFEVPAGSEAGPGHVDEIAIVTDGGQGKPGEKPPECPQDHETILEVHYPLPAVTSRGEPEGTDETTPLRPRRNVLSLMLG